MKHTLKVTLILVSLFLLAQVFGLYSVSEYIRVEKLPSGEISIKYDDTAIGPQPDLEEKDKTLSAIWIVFAVLLGTGLVFLLIKFRLGNFWRYWFLFAIWITLAVAINVYIASVLLSFGIALLLALVKVFKHNVYLHNFTEVLIYTGITIIVLPLVNLLAVVILLLLISVYDMIAVWKSKHMIKLAKFQTNSKLFAGLMIGYKRKDMVSDNDVKKASSKTKVVGKAKTAILGGGDIAFPLIFSAAVMEFLIKSYSLAENAALLETFIVTLFATLSLLVLFMLAKKDKFYPAMPFLSGGCFIGLGIVVLVNLL